MLDILHRRTSIACLVLIGLLLVGGNFVIDRTETDAAAGTGNVGASATSDSLISEPVAFSLRSKLEEAGLRQAAARLRAAEEKRDRARLRRRQLAEFRDLPGAVSRSTLESIAECESGGDPRVVSAGGLYHGKYQFSPDTWRAVGGKGLPSRAPEAEQDFRAALLYERSGPGQWPVCGN